MTCDKCGIAVPEGSRFCLSCGAQVTDPGAATVMTPAPPRDVLLEQLKTALAADLALEKVSAIPMLMANGMYFKSRFQLVGCR